MSPAIKVTNSKGVQITDCLFEGFDTAIELDNVEDFISQRNAFSKNNPQSILSKLIDSIEKSDLDNNEKKLLFRKTTDFLSTKNGNGRLKHAISQDLLKSVGKNAAEYFIQLAAAVSAGLILRIVKNE